MGQLAYWQRNIAALKTDRKAPADNFAVMIARDDAFTVLRPAGTIETYDAPAAAALVAASPDKFVWYTDGQPFGIMARFEAMTPLLVAAGGACLLCASGREVRALLWTFGENTCTIQDLGAYGCPALHNEPVIAAAVAFRHAAAVRAEVHATFGVHLQLTPASTAYKCWRRVMESPQGQEKNRHWMPSKACAAFSRHAYFGGFNFSKPGKYADRKLYHYDIRAAYSWSMRAGVPVGAGVYTVEEMRGYPAIYRVEAVLPLGLPTLFVRDHMGQMLPATAGMITTTYATDLEITFARSRGAVIRVLDGYYWPRGMGQPFGPFVERMQAWRKSASKEAMPFVKLAQNGLTGRFGRRTQVDEFRLSADVPVDDGAGAWLPWFGARGMQDDAWTRRAHKESMQGAMPHWAAYITARVRVRLLETIHRTGVDHALYADTDSLVTSVPIDTGENYGDWRLEHVYQSLEIYAGKRYSALTIDGALVVKAAGIRKGEPREMAELLHAYYEHSPPDAQHRIPSPPNHRGRTHR